MALTTDKLRTTLAAALAWPEPEVGACLAALQARGALPAADAALEPDHIVSAMLALLSGALPAAAVDEITVMRAGRGDPPLGAGPRANTEVPT